jgi:hypothetical protein
VYSAYLAFGDSMSIDLYAAKDALRNGFVCRKEIGSASLLFRNDSVLFPQFDNRDLKTKFKGIKHRNNCVDGAITSDVLSDPRPKILSLIFRGRNLITLTIGGNDLLKAHTNSISEGPVALNTGLVGMQERYVKIVDRIQKLFPRSRLILSSVYDPTDGTGILPTDPPVNFGLLPVEILGRFNSFIKTVAADNGVLFADVHGHFLGHGANSKSTKEFWYWPDSPVEPSYIGASEIRRVWLDALEKHSNGD